MFRFIETIRVENGEFINLGLHQKRMERTQSHFFKMSEFPDLADRLKETVVPDNGVFKCRIVYEDEIQRVEFSPYKIRDVHSLKLIRVNQIQYNYKSEDRSQLNELFDQRKGCDDILIVKDGLVTDSSYANIIFFDGIKWETPEKPLLPGIMREKLIQENKIFPATITVADISRYPKIKLINAMVGIDGPEIDVSAIVF